jgi:Velvet factor
VILAGLLLLPFVLLTRYCRTYYLEVVQQPEVSAEFGTAALSRLPLAPPLVAQLIIRDSRGNVIES